MEKNIIMEQFIESLVENGGENSYDFICNNYHTMSKSELADIIKELLFALYQARKSGYIMNVDEKTILANAGRELTELYISDIEY